MGDYSAAFIFLSLICKVMAMEIDGWHLINHKNTLLEPLLQGSWLNTEFHAKIEAAAEG